MLLFVLDVDSPSVGVKINIEQLRYVLVVRQRLLEICDIGTGQSQMRNDACAVRCPDKGGSTQERRNRCRRIVLQYEFVEVRQRTDQHHVLICRREPFITKSTLLTEFFGDMVVKGNRRVQYWHTAMPVFRRYVGQY